MGPGAERKPRPEGLRPWERAGLVLLAIVLLAFGVLTVRRSAFLSRRRTDADVYFRAAWAIRAGENPYKVTDTNGWHYHYPPLFAILLQPLADPPTEKGAPPLPGCAPYPVSVAILYVINLLAAVWALHILAKAIEESGGDPDGKSTRRFSRKWWKLRLIPFLCCLPMIGFTLQRGQVNLFLLLALCGTCAELLRGRNGRAGLWLALGCCFKPFLAVVLLYPLWRRNWRFFPGFLGGLAIGLVLVPLLLLGPGRMASIYRDFYELRIAGMALGQPHPDIAAELSVMTGNFPSYGASLFKALNRDSSQWPRDFPASYRNFQLALGACLALGVLLAAGWSRVRSGLARFRDPLSVGALILAILPSIHTVKPHYFALAALAVMALLASAWERAGEDRLTWGWIVLFAFYGLVTAIEEIPAFMPVLMLGAMPLSGLLLYVAALRELCRSRAVR